MTYVYDQGWQQERERLAGMEALWNPGTFALLEELGAGPGGRVADVGAGGGSVTEWLSDRVGPKGEVLACDVSLRFVSAIDRANVRTVEHDITAGPLPAEGLDLVCSRLLVEHVGTGAIANMAAALRPGGVLLVEDYDCDAAGAEPQADLQQEVVDAVVGFMERHGFDRRMGRKLPRALAAAGLVDVRAEGRVRVYQGGTPECDFGRFSLMSLRDVLVAEGAVAAADVDAVLAMLDDPATTFLSFAMIACHGRVPAG